VTEHFIDHVLKTHYCIKSKQACHGRSGSAGLQMPIHAHYFQRVILTHKVHQTDLVIGVQCGFVNRSVHARLQVSVCNSCNLHHRG